MDPKSPQSPDKIRKIFVIVLSISFSFTTFFFSPVELLLRNQKEFIISAEHIIIPMLILSLMVCTLSIVLLHILFKIHETIFIVISRIMAGMLLAFYVQEMFLNGKMTEITGEAFLANCSTMESTLNFLFCYLLLTLPIIFHFMKKKYPEVKFFQLGKEYTLPYLAGLIFLMQVFGLAGSFAQFGLNHDKPVLNAYFSYEPSLSLSQENNITVFLVDTLDTLYMDEVLETYPELYDELDGFTFYQNNLSHYPSTYPSITHMFTSIAPDVGEDYTVYTKRAWSGEVFLDQLRQNDFQVNLFPDGTTTYSSYVDLENHCDNLAYLNESDYSFNYLGGSGIIPTMVKMSFGKLLPYNLKAICINDIGSDFSSFFIRYTQANPSRMSVVVGGDSDLAYYSYLTSKGLRADNAQKTFSYFHLNGAHDVSDEVSVLYSGAHETGSFDTLATTRGEFEIILAYIHQMQELGIYERSTIIILSDHGRQKTSEEKQLNRRTSPSGATLMIKPAQAGSAPLQINASAELSNDYLAASVLEYAGIDHEKYGYSYSDVINNDIHTERILANGYYDDSVIYRITGNARDFQNWEIVN